MSCLHLFEPNSMRPRHRIHNDISVGLCLCLKPRSNPCQQDQEQPPYQLPFGEMFLNFSVQIGTVVSNMAFSDSYLTLASSHLCNYPSFPSSFKFVLERMQEPAKDHFRFSYRADGCCKNVLCAARKEKSRQEAM